MIGCHAFVLVDVIPIPKSKFWEVTFNALLGDTPVDAKQLAANCCICCCITSFIEGPLAIKWEVESSSDDDDEDGNTPIDEILKLNAELGKFDG